MLYILAFCKLQLTVLLLRNLLASRSLLLSLNVSRLILRKDMGVEKQIQPLPRV